MQLNLRKNILRTAATALVSVVALACNSGPERTAGPPQAGQSGSDGFPTGSGGSTVPCPCGVAGESRLGLRVTLVARHEDLVTLRVEEILKGDVPLVSGDMIEATWNGLLPCYLGCASLDIGDEAFAYYWPRPPPLPPCSARDGCLQTCLQERGSESWDPPCCGESCTGPKRTEMTECEDQCEGETSEACPQRPDQDYRYGEVKLSPWADEIVLAENDRGRISVPSSELNLLRSENHGMCVERFGDWSDLLDNAP